MKKQHIIYPLLVLFLTGGWFYWTQLRPTNIKKSCYTEAFRKNELNIDWAEGKVWHKVDYTYGWAYPDFEQNNYTSEMKVHKAKRDGIYKQCLLREGVSTSL